MEVSVRVSEWRHTSDGRSESGGACIIVFHIVLFGEVLLNLNVSRALLTRLYHAR